MARRLLWDRLLTKSNLFRRKILNQISETTCSLCNTEREDASHLFSGCCKTSKIWDSCFSWFGISTVSHSNILHHFIENPGILGGKIDSLFSIGLQICIVWSIWKNRNKLIFEDVPFDEEKNVQQIKGRFQSWSSVKTVHISITHVEHITW